MTEHDAVNHPSHYTAHPSGVECIAITEHMTFNAGNAVKYLWRAGLKVLGAGQLDKHLEDLKKARWYIEREIERMEKQKLQNELKIAQASAIPITNHDHIRFT